MPTQTFPCPFCGKKMGVGIELLGKKVRCPHCNQILVAPAPAAGPVPTAAPIAPTPPTPKPGLPPPPSEADLPVFNLPSQEARESIFGEHQDEGDDLFSSSEGTKLQVPDMPPLEPVPVPPVVPAPTPVPPSKERDVAVEPTVEMKSPFSGTAAPPLPRTPMTGQPVVAPIPTVAPVGATPPSGPGTNPWAGMDQLAAAPPVTVAAPTSMPTPIPVSMPVPVAAQESDSPFSTVEDEPKPKKKKRDRVDDRKDREDDRPEKRLRPAAAGQGGSPLIKIGFFVLLPYALIVTAVAAYGLFFKSSTPPGHPLSTVPDNFGEFPPAERKKTGKLTIPVDGELPADQRVALGAKLPIGQLEIEPLGVDQRLLKIVTEGKTAKDVQPGSTPALVLRMKIKNTSDDLLIHPLDPAFNRRLVGSDRIATGLVIGKQPPIWGGAITWPFPPRAIRVYEEAQVADASPLKPGETREYVVFTDASNRVVKAVREAKETILWRVQVRHGRIDFDGKNVPVTAIIGVEFKPSDVKEPD